MSQAPNLLDQAIAFHRALPARIRQYLNGRGILDGTIDSHMIGWDGRRITIPISDRNGNIVSFKLRKDPDDPTDSPKMYTTPGARVELYDWQRLLTVPESIVICEGEFDRLVLEARGFAAVTSTAGAGTFLPEWTPYFSGIPNVYLCFDNDDAGRKGAAHVAALIPHAREITWPPEIGPGGDVTDFFVGLGRDAEDFRKLLETAQPIPLSEMKPAARGKMASAEIEKVKTSLAIEDVITRYLEMTIRGHNYAGSCPFHKERTPSFIVFPRTQTFHCFGCGEHGDVLTFIMKMENLTFREALKVAQQLVTMSDEG
jgi:DNA primase